MIVIGSYAAMLGGFLPPYRGGVVQDIDIVCDADELVDLIHLSGLRLKQVFPDKFLVIDAPRVLEISVYPAGAVAAIEALCDTREVALTSDVAADCYVAPVEVVWATLSETVKCFAAPREKSLKDLAHYQTVVSQRGTLRRAHRELADFYRRRTLAQLAAAANHPRPSSAGNKRK